MHRPTGRLLAATLFLAALLVAVVTLRPPGLATWRAHERFEIIEVPGVVDPIVAPHSTGLRIEHEGPLLGGAPERVAGVLVGLRLRRGDRQEQQRHDQPASHWKPRQAPRTISQRRKNCA